MWLFNKEDREAEKENEDVTQREAQGYSYKLHI